jgi:hypothetical protein
MTKKQSMDFAKSDDIDNQSCVAEIAYNQETRRDNNNFRLDLTVNEGRLSQISELDSPFTLIIGKIFLVNIDCLGFLTYQDALRLG